MVFISVEDSDGENNAGAENSDAEEHFESLKGFRLEEGGGEARPPGESHIS